MKGRSTTWSLSVVYQVTVSGYDNDNAMRVRGRSTFETWFRMRMSMDYIFWSILWAAIRCNTRPKRTVFLAYFFLMSECCTNFTTVSVILCNCIFFLYPFTWLTFSSMILGHRPKFKMLGFDLFLTNSRKEGGS